MPNDETLSKKTILVAEDDPFYSNIYKFKLNKEGYTVFTATNGDEAIKLAKEHKPDLVLLDLIMPIKDGFETLRELKQDPLLKDVRVIVISNLGQDEDITRTKSMGAQDYLVKANMSIQEMMDKVKSYL